MNRLSIIQSRLRLAVLVAASTAWATVSIAAAPAQEAGAASALRARYAALKMRLEQSPFPRHVYIESAEGPRGSRADVFAVVDYPIATVSAASSSPANWCDALILHLNVKYCRPVLRKEGTVLSVAIGRKYDQPVSSTYRVEFVYRIAASRSDYVDVELNAPRGPLGTGNYRIALAAVGLGDERSFVHVRYSYTDGVASRAAMKMYLATTGRGKVGFTIIGDPHNPRPEYIGGVRGAIERNSMRYYLAIDAYLGSLAAPASERFEQSLMRWFDATELYPRQLHEVDRDTYLAMKRGEYRRQQTIQ